MSAESNMKQLDVNLYLREHGGKRHLHCKHCSYRLAEISSSEKFIDYLAYLIRHQHLAHYDGSVSQAGPQVASNAGHYINANVVFRQYCCPNCWTAFSTQVRPLDHNDV